MINRGIISSIVFLTINSCNTQLEDSLNFDFNHPEEQSLSKELDEISGISYLSENTILGINDEEGIIFEIELKEKTEKPLIYFKDKGDFEGVTSDEEYFYVLTSNGGIYQVSKDGEWNFFKFSKKGFEFEGLTYNKSNNSLLMACKLSSKKKFKNQILVFEFDLKTKKLKDNFYLNLTKESTLKNFKPSGIALDSESNVFLISASKAMIAKFSKEGKLIASKKLASISYPQIEGICFDTNGTMYITSEKASKKHAKLVKFKKI